VVKEVSNQPMGIVEIGLRNHHMSVPDKIYPDSGDQGLLLAVLLHQLEKLSVLFH